MTATDAPPDDVADRGVGVATRERLMRAAERLFAERGIDAVSIRDITSEADANSASIHYHFGSKAALVGAILDWRAAEVGARRAAWLDRIEAADSPTLRDVIEALVIPTAEMAADTEGGGQHHIGFIAAVLANPGLMPLVIDAFEPYTERFAAALARVTPHLDRDVRELRLALAKDMVNRVIGQPDGPVHAWIALRAPGADEPLTDRLVDFLVGAFAAPCTA
jgi:AcrR family transcriptional regulator